MFNYRKYMLNQARLCVLRQNNQYHNSQYHNQQHMNSGFDISHSMYNYQIHTQEPYSNSYSNSYS